jgi:hypothetical protein
MLRTVLLGWIGMTLIGAVAVPAARPQSSSAVSTPGAPHRAFLDRYCVGCHNAKLATAGFTLDSIDVEHVDAAAPAWEKVVHKLRTGTMPPPRSLRPEKAAYDAFAEYLETALDRAAVAKPNPGRPGPHRLNRTEYTNAIRDLLALDIDGDSLLPIDELNNGFDNIGNVLSISPVLLERYMSAARKISRLAIGDPAARPVFETYRLPAMLKQGERINEDVPFGSRGGVAIQHYFPADGEYTLRIMLQRTSRDYIRGLAEPHQLDVRLDGSRIKLFTVGGEVKGRSGPIFSQADQIGEPLQEEYESRGAEQDLEVRFTAKAGPREIAVTFLDKTVAQERVNGFNVFLPEMSQFDMVQYKGGDPAVDAVTIRGPFNVSGVGDTPSRARIFTCHPATNADDIPCARKILFPLARLAYRRPPSNEDIETLLSFFNLGRAENGFEAGIEAALQRMLVGPEFLFRIERDPLTPQNAAYRISDLDLASRLSFFLWSSIPDNELLDVATSGKLKDAAVLEKQVRRMLRDPRSASLVKNFAGQWLYLRNLSSATPDPVLFPDFDENLRDAFQQETELFLESMLREDRSVKDLLDADYTFLNERLARHYGIPGIYGSHFRRVQLPDDTRKGLLGHGSILTVTSYANRTSVVLRGKWLLENILDAPPPAPPPDVPALEGNSDGAKVLPLRQMMEKHRANPSCTSCHVQMDALGFALENFDATGRWRTTDANIPIDTSAILPDGTEFAGPAGLRKILLSHPEVFAHTVSEKLLTYGLGRNLEYYDVPAVRKIVKEAASGDYRWSDLILGVVKSTPFQMRRSQDQ